MTDHKPTSSAGALSRGSLPTEDDDHETWVTLHAFGDASHAQVVRGLLEQADIPVRLTDVHSAGLLGIPTMALGGVGLQVPQQDALRAQALIKETRRAAPGVVFAVLHRRTLTTPLWWGGATVMASSLGASFGWWPGRWVFPVVMLAVSAGLMVGRRQRFWLCSNLQCGARVSPDLATCPRCSGAVVGEIQHLDDRLEAEERYRAAQLAPPAAPSEPSQR